MPLLGKRKPEESKKDFVRKKISLADIFDSDDDELYIYIFRENQNFHFNSQKIKLNLLEIK